MEIVTCVQGPSISPLGQWRAWVVGVGGLPIGHPLRVAVGAVAGLGILVPLALVSHGEDWGLGVIIHRPEAGELVAGIQPFAKSCVKIAGRG